MKPEPLFPVKIARKITHFPKERTLTVQLKRFRKNTTKKHLQCYSGRNLVWS